MSDVTYSPVIMGDGISGLIASLITGGTVYGNSLGGQMNASFQLGPRILEKCDETVELMKGLGLYEESRNPRLFKVGHMYDFELLDSVPEALREEYFFKTRGHRNMTNKCMSSGRREIIGWSMDEIKLRERLIDKVSSRIKRVDPLTVIDEGWHWIDDVISTIPLPVLLKRLYPHLARFFNFKAHDTVFVRIPDHYVSFLSDYDYVYAIDYAFPPHRITLLHDGTAVYEIRGDRFEEFKSIYTGEILDYHILRSVQIVKDYDVDEVDDIKMLGRYAQWKHGINVKDVIRRVLNFEF